MLMDAIFSFCHICCPWIYCQQLEQNRICIPKTESRVKRRNYPAWCSNEFQASKDSHINPFITDYEIDFTE